MVSGFPELIQEINATHPLNYSKVHKFKVKLFKTSESSNWLFLTKLSSQESREPCRLSSKKYS